MEFCRQDSIPVSCERGFDHTYKFTQNNKNNNSVSGVLHSLNKIIYLLYSLVRRLLYHFYAIEMKDTEIFYFFSWEK